MEINSSRSKLKFISSGLLRTWRRILPCRLSSAKRSNGLSRNAEDYWRVGRDGFQRKSGRSQHLDYLARYAIWAGLTSFFLRFLFTFTSSHVFSRRLMRPNAGVHASPRVPVKRPRHLISYGWRHLRQSSHGPPHPHLLSRPVDKDLWCHSSSASLPPPSFLPYSSLILPLLYSREFCRLFFFLSFFIFIFEREGGSYRNFFSFFREGRKEFSVS